MSRMPLAALLAAACASGGPALRPEPHSFQDVRTVALVRRVEDPGAVQGKDPLDALRESLTDRGYDARLVRIGRGQSAAPAVERLYALVDGRVAARASPDRLGSRIERVSAADAATALAALGTDAMAVYHRFVGPPLLLPPPTSPLDPYAPPGSPYATRADPIPYQPLGAISLVDRDGYVVWFDWGAPAPADADVPANAAEAVDALLRVLAGESADAP